MRNTSTLATACIFLSIGASPLLAQSEVVLAPTKDASLYQENGSFGNGAGQYLFTGKTRNGGIRHALLAFDIAGSVPEGATITEAELTLRMTKRVGAGLKVTIHPLLWFWGDGATNAGGEEGGGTSAAANDATWLHTFFDTATWQSAGGDFEPAESASTDVAGIASYSWSGPGMISDVQKWLDAPPENFGWILVGDPEGANRNAKRFDSREHPTVESRPNLRIAFSTSTGTSADDVPKALLLHGNFPNPFGGVSAITYELTSPGEVRLDVHDIQGRKIETLVNGFQSAGLHRVSFDASTLAPGTYVYRISSSTFDHTAKLVVLP
jgi:hypothetical protein